MNATTHTGPQAQEAGLSELLALNDNQLAILDDNYGSEPGESGGAMPCEIGDYGAPEGIEFATVIYNDRKICECYTDDDAAVVAQALNFTRDRHIHFKELVNQVAYWKEMHRAALSTLQSGAEGKDGERLDWLMRKVSGKELRDIGIDTFDGCTREAIDAARSGGKS